MNNYLRALSKMDFVLLGLVYILIAFGLSALYSIALSKGVPDFGNFTKQLFFIGIGSILMCIFACIDFRFWRGGAKLIYLLSLVMLVGVLLFGKTIRGTTGWFVVGGFQFQPIELVKMFLIFVLAYYFSSLSKPLYQTKHIVISFLLMFVVFFLSLLQPDLGSAMLLGIIWLGMVSMLGLKKWQWGVMVAVFLFASVFAWFFVLHDYQKERVLSALNPTEDLLGQGYAVNQSVIAIGSGKIIGTGLGFGSQSQLKFLPESHTDFIFSVIAEELGFLGASILLVFTGIFLLRLLYLTKSIQDGFATFFIIGATILFFSQIILNVGVTLGLLPVTGVTFPLVSYGGTSLLVSFMLIGIVQSIWIRRHTS